MIFQSICLLSPGVYVHIMLNVIIMWQRPHMHLSEHVCFSMCCYPSRFIRPVIMFSRCNWNLHSTITQKGDCWTDSSAVLCTSRCKCTPIYFAFESPLVPKLASPPHNHLLIISHCLSSHPAWLMLVCKHQTGCLSYRKLRHWDFDSYSVLVCLVWPGMRWCFQWVAS